MDQITIISICVAGAVTMFVLSLCRMMLGERDVRLHRRFGEIAQPGAPGSPPPSPWSSIRTGRRCSGPGR